MKRFETDEGVEAYIKMCEGFNNSKFKSIILNNLNVDSSLLEIGMGSGNDFKWLSKLYNVTGSDNSKKFIEKARNRFPDGKFILLDAISLETNNKYDGIYSCKVYQYFELDLIGEALKKQHEILNKDGIIIHSFWIGNTVFDDGDMKAIYHNKMKLLSLISKNFTLVEQIEYEEFEPHDSIFIVAKKK